MVYVILLALVGYILFFYGLGAFPLIGDSEGNYAEIAREMVELKDYIVPHLNYVPYLEKPPLFYWLTAITYKLLGHNETAARLWAAIPAFGLVIVAYVFGLRLKCRGLGVRSGLVLAASAGFVMMSKICYMDMLFSFLIGLSLLMFYLGLKDSKKIYFYLFYVSLALAVLAKGFAGVILPGLVVTVYLTVSRSWPEIKKACILQGLIIFLIITVPWHAAAAAKNGEFLWYYFINEHLYRYMGIRYPKDYFHGPVYYHLLRVFALLFPWSIFIPAAVYLYIKKLRKNRDWLFLSVWFLTILAFFSVSRAKANYYMLSALVPAAVLIGWIWDKVAVDTESKVENRFFGATFGAYILAGFVCIGVMCMAPKIIIENFQLSFFPKALAILILLSLSGAVSAYLFSMNKIKGAFAAFFAGAVAAGFIISQNIPALNPERSAKDFAIVIDKNYLDGDKIVVRGKYEKNSTLSFYLKKRVYVVCEPWRVDGDLDFGSRYPENRKYFLDWKEFLKMFGSGERVFFLTHEPSDIAALKEKFPEKTKVLLQESGRYLAAN